MSGESGNQRGLEVGALIDSVPVSALQWRVFLLCSVALLLNGFDIQVMGLCVPLLAEEWQLPPSAFTIAVSASLIGMAVGAAALSLLADRWGRRPTQILTLTLIGVSTLAALLTHRPAALAICRLFTGAGLGAAVPVAITLAAEYAPSRLRTLIATMIVSCAAIGGMATGFLAPVLAQAWGWRGIMAVGGLAPLVGALLCALALPESLRFLVRHGLDHAGIARQVQAIAPAHGGAGIHVAQATRAARSVADLFTPRFRARTLLLWAIFWMNLAVNYALISWLPTILHGAGWSHAAAARGAGVLSIGGLLGGLILAACADRGRTIPAVVGAYVLAALVLAAFPLAPGGTAVWVVLLTLVGIGTVGVQMMLGSLAAFFYPIELRSTGLGWSSGVGRIGGILGPVAVAALLAHAVPTARIVGLLTIPVMLCVVGTSLLPRALGEDLATAGAQHPKTGPRRSLSS